MKRFDLAVPALVTLTALIAAALLLYLREPGTPPSTGSTLGALPTPTPTASPLPALLTYTNTDLGISFSYPAGYYALEDKAAKEISVRTMAKPPAGTSLAAYRTVSISYDSNAAAYESVVTKLKGSERTDIPVSGGTIRLYTYSNPSHPDRTLAMAFFSGKYSFTANMSWDAYDASQEEATSEAAEVEILRQILPTVLIAK